MAVSGALLITGTDAPSIPGLAPGYSLHDDMDALDRSETATGGTADDAVKQHHCSLATLQRQSTCSVTVIQNLRRGHI
jgi:hypothetical protein